jgi:hypothetical protein
MVLSAILLQTKQFNLCLLYRGYFIKVLIKNWDVGMLGEHLKRLRITRHEKAIVKA